MAQLTTTKKCLCDPGPGILVTSCFQLEEQAEARPAKQARVRCSQGGEGKMKKEGGQRIGSQRGGMVAGGTLEIWSSGLH